MKRKIQTAIDQHYQDYQMTPIMKQSIINQISNEEYEAGGRASRIRQRRQRSNQRLRPVLAMAAALCLTVILSVPVLGAVSPAVNAILARLSPQFAGFLMPVTGSAVDQGIEIRLISAVADDYNLMVNLEVEDLKAERLSEDMSFRVESPGTGAYHALDDYDQETNIMTFCWIATLAERYTGEEITLRIDQLIGHEAGYLDGEWELSFTPGQMESWEVRTDFTIGSARVQKCRITPIGLWMEGTDVIPIGEIELEIIMNNGDQYYVGTDYQRDDLLMESSLTTTEDEDRYTVVVFFGSVINIDEIESIVIAGERIWY